MTYVCQIVPTKPAYRRYARRSSPPGDPPPGPFLTKAYHASATPVAGLTPPQRALPRWAVTTAWGLAQTPPYVRCRKRRFHSLGVSRTTAAQAARPCRRERGSQDKVPALLGPKPQNRKAWRLAAKWQRGKCVTSNTGWTHSLSTTHYTFFFSPFLPARDFSSRAPLDVSAHEHWTHIFPNRGVSVCRLPTGTRTTMARQLPVAILKPRGL